MLPWLLGHGTPADDNALRASHLGVLHEIASLHGVAGGLTTVLEQLYWTLYLGVVAQWTQDQSPHQEETLALLDQSLILFCSALQSSSSAASHEWEQ